MSSLMKYKIASTDFLLVFQELYGKKVLWDDNFHSSFTQTDSFF